MDDEVTDSLFDELRSLRERVEELERQLAALTSSVQRHTEALKILLIDPRSLRSLLTTSSEKGA